MTLTSIPAAALGAAALLTIMFSFPVQATESQLTTPAQGLLLAQSTTIQILPRTPPPPPPPPTVPKLLTIPANQPRKECNGETTEECCAGISYCACTYCPFGGTKPLVCISSPP